MKKLLFVVLFALATVCASAQYKGDVAVDSLGGIMVKKGGTLVLDGVKVRGHNAETMIPEYYDRWRKVNLGYNIGLGLTTTGCTLFITSAAAYMYARNNAPAPPSTWAELVEFYEHITSIDSYRDFMPWERALIESARLKYLSFPFLVAGIPTLCVYNSRLKQLATAYNEGHRNQDVSLSFGGQNNGIGFALNF